MRSRLTLALTLTQVGTLAGCAGDDGAASSAASDTTSESASAGPGSSGGTDSTSTGGSSGNTADSGSSSDATGGSSGGSTDGSTGGSVECDDVPDPEPAWMLEYQDDIVARLAGAEELTPGVTLSDRSTTANRDATREFLVAEWTALGFAPKTQAYSPTGTNVFADLAPDAEVPSEEVVVLGAHFDSVPGSPGANDNATGVAMVLASAAYLAQVPCRTRGVVFVLFDEEEVGLIGSDAFAGLLADQAVPLHSAHTVDQMGWDNDGDRALELERPDPGLYDLYATTATLGGFGMNLVETSTGSTDHVSFRAHGFDAVGITEEYVSGDTTPHYHLPTDTYDTVDITYLVSTSALVNATLARLSQGEE